MAKFSDKEHRTTLVFGIVMGLAIVDLGADSSKAILILIGAWWLIEVILGWRAE